MWKIPAFCFFGSCLDCCCVGVAIQCLVFSWMAEGRGKIMQHAGKPDEGMFTHCLTIYCCAACTFCQVRQAIPARPLQSARPPQSASALADTQHADHQEANYVNKAWEANGRQPLGLGPVDNYYAPTRGYQQQQVQQQVQMVQPMQYVHVQPQYAQPQYTVDMER